MEKQLICINCPMGCRLIVTLNDEAVTRVEGNVCNQGESYARQEAVCPVRVVTSLMFAQNRDKPFSVKTSRPIPKDKIFTCVEKIFSIMPVPPIRCGDVVISNVCGTGADVVATRDLL